MGIATLVLTKITIAPDILGYASSLTRDNSFAPTTIETASHLDGMKSKTTSAIFILWMRKSALRAM